MDAITACPICLTPTETSILDESHLYSFWRKKEKGCPDCVQHYLLQTLLDEGHAVFHERVQVAWPIDAEAAFGVIPTPLRLHADPRFAGRGVTLAVVDSGFYPHPDLTLPQNRIRAWADAGSEPVRAIRFSRDETPRWPGSSEASAFQWHGLMTSVVAAGNGLLSRGLYRGLASEADVVLVQARDVDGRITNETIDRALRWIADNGDLHISVVNLSVAGEEDDRSGSDLIDDTIEDLVERGVVVVAAAGNDGIRRLLPPASCPVALTVGGIDDKNGFDHDVLELWHSNYGLSSNGHFKPELVAPSIWVAAPVLPGTSLAREALELLSRRDPSDEHRIAELKLINPYYQHVDGTSFAAPVVASAVACMVEANMSVSPWAVRDLLRYSSDPVPGVSRERQGAGVLDAGRAVALALQEHHSRKVVSPEVGSDGVRFTLHDHACSSVRVLGSWDAWRPPGLIAAGTDGIWMASCGPLPAGRHLYKYLLDNARWLDDPSNPMKAPDGLGGFNSILDIPPSDY